MPALPKNVDLDPDGVSVWKCYLLPAEEFALKKEANVARTEDSDDVIGVRVLGGFLLDFYKHANVVAETGHTPYYKRILFEIKSCFKSVTSDHDEACFKAVIKLGLGYHNYLMRICE